MIALPLNKKTIICLLLIICVTGFSQNNCQIVSDDYTIIESKHDTLRSVIEFANLPKNLNDGKWKQLYVNNCIRYKVIFLNSELNGEALIYWPNGNTMYKCLFKEGKAYSNWCFYASDGVIHTVFCYSKGVFLRKSKSFNQYGKLYQIIYYNSDDKSDIKKIKTIKRNSPFKN